MDNMVDNVKAQFSYSIENRYEDEAFTEFQKKYVVKKNILRSIFGVFAIVLFAKPLLKNPVDGFSWSMIGLVTAIIFLMWFNMYLVKKKLLISLKQLENDVYQCTIYEDRFTIKTIECKSLQDAMDKIEDIEPEDAEKISAPEKIEDIPPSVIRLDNDKIYAVEKHEIFIIMYGKQTIYVFPKNKMTENDISVVRDIFKEKLKENFATL